MNLCCLVAWQAQTSSQYGLGLSKSFGMRTHIVIVYLTTCKSTAFAKYYNHACLNLRVQYPRHLSCKAVAI